jgi:hypothetical protein
VIDLALQFAPQPLVVEPASGNTPAQGAGETELINTH